MPPERSEPPDQIFRKQRPRTNASGAKCAYIDSHRFSRYSLSIMSASTMSADASLDRALHAIADPTRRKILLALREGKSDVRSPGKPDGESCLCAGDIEQRMKLSQPTISHHMAILIKAGLVEASKQGQWRWYRRNEKAIRNVVKTLRGKL